MADRAVDPVRENERLGILRDMLVPVRGPVLPAPVPEPEIDAELDAIMEDYAAGIEGNVAVTGETTGLNAVLRNAVVLPGYVYTRNDAEHRMARLATVRDDLSGQPCPICGRPMGGLSVQARPPVRHASWGVPDRIPLPDEDGPALVAVTGCGCTLRFATVETPRILPSPLASPPPPAPRRRRVRPD